MKEVLPTVAIVGRPNVGKSTLFNALIGEKKSIVSNTPGTTRDRVTQRVTDLGQIPFWLVDTAGLSDFGNNSLEQAVQTQARIAIDHADCVIWVVDGQKELTQDDYSIAEILRPKSEKVLFCANKIDDGNGEKTYDFASLGFGLPILVSAKNNFGFWEFVDVLTKKIKSLGFEEVKLLDEDPDTIKVALIGRPNVGKSTLFNQLLGHTRSIVSDSAGTTRDAIDTEFIDESGQKYCFIDTAGVRKKGKIGRDMEFWSVLRTQRSIERSDICILLIDSLDGVTHQDLALAGKIVEEGKGLILGINKFDLVQEKSKAKTESDDRELAEVPMWDRDMTDIKKRYLYYLQQKISFVPWAPVLFFSGKTGKGVSHIFDSLKGIQEERSKRIPTGELNLLVPDIYYGHTIPCKGNKKGKIKYVSQVDIRPPKFIFFVNNKEAFHFSYRRYIENRIREKYGFSGTPIIIEMRDAMKNWQGNPENKEKNR